jgi:dsRNA-specific ribonuclease
MTYQQQLKTYVDRNKLSMIYEDKLTDNKQYVARVILNEKIYEWCVEQPNKKNAKQMAAKIVLDLLDIESIEKSEETTRDILIDIRELLRENIKMKLNNYK